ncbi:MAG TPA: diacylglycerol kinase family protein, partial [Dongiaceae bacterium]|nr:diacylglycerol kinase family protein [Dongiaceae bacterium]
MNKVGILSNARSRRNQTAMPAIEALLKGEPKILHRSFKDIAALPQCLHELAQAGIGHLIINGGDGTVQATIGELFRHPPFQELPRISLVGGGMTNVIAHDVGIPAAPVDAIRRVLQGLRAEAPGESLRRHTLTLKRSGHDRTEYGFLSGAVGFYQGTMLSRRDMHRVGFRQSVAAKAGIIWSVVRLLLHGEGQRSGLQGERVAIGLNGQPPQEAPYFLILATTLERLLPGVMPFWGHDKGAIKLTTVASPPKRFGLAALPAVRGRPRPWMHRAGYASTRADHV